MCGRADNDASGLIAEKAGLEDNSGGREKDPNAPPGTERPVILDARPGQLNYIRWGLIPHWATERPKFNTNYARIEEMHNLPSYRHLVGRRHCVLVVNGFYEWLRSPTKAPNQPYYFRRKDEQLLYLAGLWDTWKDPKSGATIVSFALIMQPANHFVGQIHDRVGVILEKQDLQTWLDRSLPPADRLSVLKPVPEDLLEGWPVDKKVNNAGNKDQDLDRPNGPALFDE